MKFGAGAGEGGWKVGPSVRLLYLNFFFSFFYLFLYFPLFFVFTLPFLLISILSELLFSYFQFVFNHPVICFFFLQN